MLLVVLTKFIFPSFTLSWQRRGVILVKLADEAKQAAVLLLL